MPRKCNIQDWPVKLKYYSVKVYPIELEPIVDSTEEHLHV